MNKEVQQELAKAFHKMHHSSNILILPNAWDAGSAVIFEKEGYEAVGTTSAGISYSLGVSDGEFITIDDVLDTVKKIQKRISIPLSVDCERGYGKTNEEIVKNIKAIIQAGAVGINIEDGLSSTCELTNMDEQCQIITDICTLKDELNINFVINARTDAFWLKIAKTKEEQLALSIERANRYLKAGADCVFVPGVLTKEDIETLVRHIQGPLNIIATPTSPNIRELQELGVSRVSLGSGPVRASLAVIKNIAHEIKEKGTFHNMYTTSIAYDKANFLFK